MTELGLLFPYTAVYLLDELFSPIITPFILIFHLRYFLAYVFGLAPVRFIKRCPENMAMLVNMDY